MTYNMAKTQAKDILNGAHSFALDWLRNADLGDCYDVQIAAWDAASEYTDNIMQYMSESECAEQISCIVFDEYARELFGIPCPTIFDSAMDCFCHVISAAVEMEMSRCIIEYVRELETQIAKL